MKREFHEKQGGESPENIGKGPGVERIMTRDPTRSAAPAAEKFLEIHGAPNSHPGAMDSPEKQEKK